MNKWASEFGVDYTQRQPINMKARAQIFKSLFDGINFSWVLEVGSNAGHNLTAISSFRDCMYLIGLEINRQVASNSQRFTVVGEATNIPFGDKYFNLVFTSGVLIHIPEYEKAMREIYRVSNKYIMAIEYMDGDREIPYRDGVYCHAKPYKDIYLKLFPDLKVVKEGNMKDFGIDDGLDFSRACQYVIFEK